MEPRRYALSTESRSPPCWTVVLKDPDEGALCLSATHGTTCGGLVRLDLAGFRFKRSRTESGLELVLQATDLQLTFAYHRVRDRMEIAEAFTQFTAWLLSDAPQLVELPSRTRSRSRVGARFVRRRRP